MQQARPHVTEQVSVAVTCIPKVTAPCIGRNPAKPEVFRGLFQPLQTHTLMMTMMMTNKFVRIWKDTVMTSFEVPFQYFSERTGENHEVSYLTMLYFILIISRR
jgi:hypothetical protein